MRRSEGSSRRFIVMPAYQQLDRKTSSACSSNGPTLVTRRESPRYEEQAVLADPPGQTTVGREAIRRLWERSSSACSTSLFAYGSVAPPA
jgi:hypothetical protein